MRFNPPLTKKEKDEMKEKTNFKSWIGKDPGERKEKTLKHICNKWFDKDVKELICSMSIEDRIKEVVVKWVKEDFQLNDLGLEDTVTKRWMKRLNITSEDLK